MSDSATGLSELVETLKARRAETLANLPAGVRRSTAEWIFDQEIAFLESGADESTFQAAPPPRLVIEGQNPQDGLKEHEEMVLRTVMSRRIAPKLFGQRGLEKPEGDEAQTASHQAPATPETTHQEAMEQATKPHRPNRNLTRV